MKILGMLQTKDEFDDIKKYTSGIILTNRFSSYYDIQFSDSLIEEILKKEPNQECYALVNKILFEEDLDEIHSFIERFKDTKLYFIFADLAVYQILKELNITSRGVYNPNTLISNYVDLLFWESKDIKGVFPTLEIPLNDVKKICHNKTSNIFYQAFGYAQMFQTKRQILSAYKEYKNVSFDTEKNDMYLVEETRNERYKIIENNANSIIFQSGIHSILEGLPVLINDCDYIMIDHRFIDKNDYLFALNIYDKAINDIQNISKYQEELSVHFNNLTTDFMYQDSIFKKEDFW